MEHKRKGTLHRWELALLMGMCTALLAGTWLTGGQRSLSQRLVRLHVIAVSDAPEDQAVKLRVRDAVLARAEPWLEGVTDPAQAAEVLSTHMEELARIGAETAGVPVSASLEENAWFPTKEYNGFSLPAGRYTALKLTLGEGEGQNWWCVMFPPLCMASVSETETELAGSFSEDQVRLITGDGGGYTVRFRAMELWNTVTDQFAQGGEDGR